MSEFSQNGVVATLHDFSNRDIDKIENDLKAFSKDRKMELVLPLSLIHISEPTRR